VNGSRARYIGRWRQVEFGAGEIDLMAADVDLLVVGMHEPEPGQLPRGGTGQIDLLLQGTLGRLREGGIFTGHFGETLMLARPAWPIRARTLMLLGMGPARPGGAGFDDLAGLAMGAALRLGAGSVACLLGWSDLAIPPDAVTASAAGMMRGALRAIDADAARDRDVPLRWMFDCRNGGARRARAALRRSLRNWR